MFIYYRGISAIEQIKLLTGLVIEAVSYLNIEILMAYFLYDNTCMRECDSKNKLTNNYSTFANE